MTCKMQDAEHGMRQACKSPRQKPEKKREERADFANRGKEWRTEGLYVYMYYIISLVTVYIPYFM